VSHRCGALRRVAGVEAPAPRLPCSVAPRPVGGSVAFAHRKIKAGLTGGACCAVSFLVASPVRVRRVPLPGRVIVVAVRWYLRYGLPYRDVEELLNERGIEVDQVTVYRRVQRFTPLPADAARFARHTPGDRWFVDET
jgi:hypothetical protein